MAIVTFFVKIEIEKPINRREKIENAKKIMKALDCLQQQLGFFRKRAFSREK